MNPLASTKCAARLLMALAAIAGLFLTAGCGNSSLTKANPEGFTNASLTGTYVFSSSGVDSTNGVFLAVAGSFGADGSGNVTGGNIDVNSLSFGQSSTAISAGTAAYSVGSDGRGQITLNTSGGVLPGIVLDFVLTSSSHGLVTEFDGDGTGSGTLDLQTTGALTGSYSFGLSGSTSAATPLAMVGTFNSATTNGLADINSNGTSTGLTDLALTATVTAGSPGTASLVSSAGTYNFDVYMVDVTHLKFIETDTAQIMTGDAFTQQTTIPQGIYAYAMEGLDSSAAPLAMAGFFTSDGSSILSAGLQDYNDAGTVPSTPLTGFGGAFTTITGGRTQLTLNSIYNGVAGVSSSPTFAAYPSSGGIELLEIDNGGITGGLALPQGSTTTISTTPGYGLNLSAINGNGGSPFEEDDIAQFVVDSNGNYSGPEDINDEGTTTPGVAFTGTLTPNSAAPGYGSVTNSSEFNFNYYVANNGSTTLILETDSNQLGLGSFESQSSTQSDVRAAAAHAQFLPVRVMPKGKAAWKKHTK